MAVKQRRGKDGQGRAKAVPTASDNTAGTFEKTADRPSSVDMKSMIKRQPVWMVLAVASGACAAINGVFAKLTTTSLTSSLATRLATVLGLSPDNNTVGLVLRGTFFALNLLFNGIMWTLYTAALTKGTSTTRVSIINVSANFFITAMLGWAIFSEKLPLGWWMGASLLAAGNVVIGSREEGEKPGSVSDEGRDGEDMGLMNQPAQGDLIDLDETSHSKSTMDADEEDRMRRAEDADAPL